MATAGMGISEKLSKQDRKLMKKQHRTQQMLLKRYNVETANRETQHLVVANGGLGNNVSRDDLEHYFSSFGEILAIIMEPEKPYSFISYANTEEAIAANKSLNGSELKCGTTFYISYVRKVPGLSIPEMFELPPGLIIEKDFIDEECEKYLLDCIDWDEIDENVLQDSKDVLKHRKVKHYGYEFIYGINNVDINNPLKKGIPDECNSVMDKLLEKKLISSKPDQLTVNQYEPGQGIPPHIDTHSAFEDKIVSLSLGSQVVIDFKHPDGRHIPVLLPQRSVIVMTGESRYVWTHGITPRKTDIIPIPASNEIQPDGKDSTQLTLSARKTRTSFTLRKVLGKPCTCQYPKQCDSQKVLEKSNEKKKKAALPLSKEEALKLEETHVHKVYEDIAGHFSDTRHTPWPKVVEFLNDLPNAALVADVGCGNGKYLGVNKDTLCIGNDRSLNLCKICKERNFEVFACDILSIPLRTGVFDAFVCIAVVHHLSTEERRLKAVEQLVNLLSPGGRGLIYVWALEQERNKNKSNYLKESKIQAKQTAEETLSSASGDADRCKGELESKSEEVSGAATNKVAISDDLDEKMQKTTIEDKNVSNKEGDDASLKLHVNRTHFENQDVLVPWHLQGKDKGKSSSNSSPKKEEDEVNSLYHRYYHVFRESELETLCHKIGNVKIIKSYYDKGNWCVIFEKLS